MDVETAVREIDEAVHKHVGSAGQSPAGSRVQPGDGEEEGFRTAVRGALETVESAVGGEGVDDLTRFVDGYIREHEQCPSVTAVEEQAAAIVRDHGEEVPADAPLQNV